MKNIVQKEKRELKKILRTFSYPYQLIAVAKDIPIYRVTFEHRYIQNFEKRFADWFDYYVCKIQNFFRTKPQKHDEPFKPIHLKHSSMPIDELKLRCILKKNDFRIIEEDLGNDYTAYDITKL